MLRKWCEITSCNGVVDLYEARESKIKFAFWAVVMVLMTTASVWFTYRTILGYIETPTVTNVATISEISMELPEILICYDGGLNVSAMRAANFSDDLIQSFSLCLFKDQCSYTSTEHDELKSYMQKNNVTMIQLLDQFGYDCDEILCPNPGISCNSSRSIFGMYGGKCHWFKPNQNQTHPDKAGGILMKLVEPENSFFNTFSTVALNAFMFGSFSMMMEKRFVSQMSTRCVQIPVNVNADIVLKPKRFVRTTSSTDACFAAENVATSNSCFFSCFNREMADSCNCTSAKYWDSSGLYNLCDPFSLQTCNPDFEKMQQCHDQCLPICDEWIFENSVTYKSIDGRYLTQPSSFVAIYYDSMQYLQIEEVAAFTIDMAIANVGGQSGLWLGASVVTVIQALYYIILSMVNYMYNGKRNTEVMKQKKSSNGPRLAPTPPNLY